MDSDNSSKERDTSEESTEVETDESNLETSQDLIEISSEPEHSDSNNENLVEKQRQGMVSEISEIVVRDVLQDVIEASAEMSDKSTETTDSEMDITVDRVDIFPLGKDAELEYSNETSDDKPGIEIEADIDNDDSDSVKEIVLNEVTDETYLRKRKKPDLISIETSGKSPRNESETVSEKHPGVFVASDTPPQIVDIPKLGSKKSEIEFNKAILDSLPVIEKLRGLSRAGSVKDDASMSGALSEVGDNMSDKDSVASGMVTRNLRRKDHRKPVAKAAPKAKKTGLNTRSGRGKGRRNIFKKKPMKGLTATATPITSDKVYYKGQYLHVGDIVSVTNIDDNDIYYAQLRGFLTDEYSDKSAAITWLLPTTASPPPNEGFHPATYIIGPEEELPRKLEVFTFVMHAPDDYFYNRRAPYRTETRPTGTKYTSVRLGPRLRKTIDNKDVYVGMY